VQFGALLEDGLYFEIAKKANLLADKIRDTLDALGYTYLVPGVTNQIFPILPDDLLENLAKEFSFSEQERVDEDHRAIRFCTSWATTEENVNALCDALQKYSK
jgi:threonine aldolase